jgi:hypothetical protein
MAPAEPSKFRAVRRPIRLRPKRRASRLLRGDRLLLRGAYRGLLLLIVALTLAPVVAYDDISRLSLAKLFLIVFLMLFPGWLYVRFAKNLEEVYDEYVLNLFRLKIDRAGNLPAPPRYSSYYPIWRQDHDHLIGSNVQSELNIYRRKFQDVYGSYGVSTQSLFHEAEVEPPQRRRGAETFSSVLVLTVLLGVAWSLILRPDTYREVRLLADFTLPTLPNLPDLPYQTLMFGFFGAYAFILQDLVRRYYRHDLKSLAYIGATVRIVVVTLLVSVVQLIPGLGVSPQSGIIAFLVGSFPQSAYQFLRNSVNQRFAKSLPNMSPSLPLTDLDGLSIWHEGRLLEEGIEDIQNLVTFNLVDLILVSRVPIARLVDWLDQSCLYLRIPKTPGGSGEAEDLSVKDITSPRDKLHLLGIRTATDLERAWSGLDTNTRQTALGKVFDTDAETGLAVVKSILLGLQSESVLSHIRAFKNYTWLAAPESPPTDR